MNSFVPFTKDFANGQQALVIRADVETDPDSVAAALELYVPSGVLILSGGAGFMSGEMFAQLSALFRAIGETAVRNHITVIDGGTEAGVMALMGKALVKAGRTMPHVGVLPAYAEVVPGGPIGQEVMEPHHSHFILVESDQWGGEVKLMYRLAAYIAGQRPSLTLLINGGGISLVEVERNVEDGREVIVVVGSGRLADEIAETIRHPEREARERVAAVVRDGHLTLFDLEESPDKLAQLVKQRLTYTFL